MPRVGSNPKATGKKSGRAVHTTPTKGMARLAVVSPAESARASARTRRARVLARGEEDEDEEMSMVPSGPTPESPDESSASSGEREEEEEYDDGATLSDAREGEDVKEEEEATMGLENGVPCLACVRSALRGKKRKTEESVELRCDAHVRSRVTKCWQCHHGRRASCRPVPKVAVSAVLTLRRVLRDREASDAKIHQARSAVRLFLTQEEEEVVVLEDDEEMEDESSAPEVTPKKKGTPKKAAAKKPVVRAPSRRASQAVAAAAADAVGGREAYLAAVRGFLKPGFEEAHAAIYRTFHPE